MSKLAPVHIYPDQFGNCYASDSSSPYSPFDFYDLMTHTISRDRNLSEFSSWSDDKDFFVASKLLWFPFVITWWRRCHSTGGSLYIFYDLIRNILIVASGASNFLFAIPWQGLVITSRLLWNCPQTWKWSSISWCYDKIHRNIMAFSSSSPDVMTTACQMITPLHLNLTTLRHRTCCKIVNLLASRSNFMTRVAEMILGKRG